MVVSSMKYGGKDTEIVGYELEAIDGLERRKKSLSADFEMRLKSTYES